MSELTVTPGFNATRRQFAAMGVAAVAATGISTSASAVPLDVATRTVTVPTDDGSTDGILFAPRAGNHPGVVMLASAAAGREANQAVARQLAGQGWAVLLIDASGAMDPRKITRDARANAAWLDAQPGVAKAADGYSLRSFSAAFPKMSLANREQRKLAASSGVMFAVPAKAAAKHDSLSEAARTLHRLAA